MYHKVAGVGQKKWQPMNLLIDPSASLFLPYQECALCRMPILAVLGMTPKHNHHPVGS
jgi:hypothetical protein